MSEEERQTEKQRWEKMREKREGMSDAERKSRTENRNPDKQAQKMAYFSAVQSRMKERGIEPPKWGGGPGGGGPRRGPGG